MHRGLTWHDASGQVVWLCAYAPHRSVPERNIDQDAFKIFPQLDLTNSLLPVQGDYDKMEKDRDERFNEEFEAKIQQLLSQAKKSPGVEYEDSFTNLEKVIICIEVAEDLSEIWVSIHNASSKDRALLLAAIDPYLSLKDWDIRDNFNGRVLTYEEYAYAHLYG